MKSDFFDFEVSAFEVFITCKLVTMRHHGYRDL